MIAGARRYASERAGKDPTYTMKAKNWLPAQSWLNSAMQPVSPTGIGNQFGGSAERWARAVLNTDGGGGDRRQRSAALPAPSGVPAHTATDGGGFTNKAGTVTFTGAELAELREQAYTVTDFDTWQPIDRPSRGLRTRGLVVAPAASKMSRKGGQTRTRG
jgi:hypothetical protein